MLSTTATIRTASARRYLGQFAKHFAHKLPVELAEDNGAATVPFPIGSCRLTADAAQLHLALAADTAEDIARLQQVTTSHLVRFAFREEILLNWEPVAAA